LIASTEAIHPTATWQPVLTYYLYQSFPRDFPNTWF